ELRRDVTTRRIPVVVLSADAKRDRAPLLAAGASAYLTKPIGVRRLLEGLDRFLAVPVEEPARPLRARPRSRPAPAPPPTARGGDGSAPRARSARVARGRAFRPVRARPGAR